jgi:hypothetical protein
MLEYQFQPIYILPKQTTQQNRTRKIKISAAEKKKYDLIKLEEELIHDTYEVLKLELDNTTLTKEILTLKAQYENNEIT